MTRVAVIGAGVMGRNHLRVWHEMPGVTLVGVADVDAGGAKAVGALHGVPAYTSCLELLGNERPEAVSIAVPTHLHRAVAIDCLRAGVHVLVEKPVAATAAEAREMMTEATRQKRVLAVGHVERFNPAVVELKRRLNAGELGRLFQISARRLGPFPSRVRDVGVVVDLATHDVDIMRFLTRSEAVRVYAESKREVHTSNEDLVTGMIRFADETIGLLQINWLTPTKIRELTLTGERGMFRADYLTQDLYFFENAQVAGTQWQPLSVLRGVSEGKMTRFPVQKREPLRAEFEAFVAATEGEHNRIVTGADGLAALELAMALVRSAREAQVVKMEHG